MAMMNRRDFLKGAGAAAAGVVINRTMPETAHAESPGTASPVVRRDRRRTLVISDLHLCVDDRVSKCVRNRPVLVDFLDQQRRQREVDEVVIAGDFLDHWWYPVDYEHETNSDAFYRRAASNNADVIEALYALMKDGISLAYVPGNHDMTLDHRTLEDILPGILQPREIRGLGTYRTGCRGEVVIEHCHRYHPGSCPNSLSNRQFMVEGSPILPWGFFVSRLNLYCQFTGGPGECFQIPNLPHPEVADPGSYAYFIFWLTTLNDEFSIRDGFDAKVLPVDIDGLKGTFSCADLMPALQADGSLRANLYGDVSDDWFSALTRINGVRRHIPLVEALSRTFDQEFYAENAVKQYFDQDPTVDVVVFGHTHFPFYREYTGYGVKKIYANSGCWIDTGGNDPDNAMSFVVIESSADDTQVSVQKCIGNDRVDDIVPVKNKYVQ